MAFLIDDFVFWIGEKIKDVAEQELYGSKDKIHEQLLAFQAKLDMGEISEEEYQTKEKELLDKLTEMRESEEEEKEEEEEEK